MRLIFVSTLGNYLYFSSLMYNKILENNQWPIWQDLKESENRQTKTKVAIEMSCFLSNA